jgi:hypothetical protein
MPYYYHIYNEKLRELVKASESIHSLSEDDAQDMVNQIAALPEDGQAEMIKALESEQNAIQEAKIAKGITPEQEIRQLDEAIAQVGTIKRDFESSVRRYNEEVARKQESQEAEDLLKEIDNT